MQLFRLPKERRGMQTLMSRIAQNGPAPPTVHYPPNSSSNDRKRGENTISHNINQPNRRITTCEPSPDSYRYSGEKGTQYAG